ncbi:hypothetical protein HMPREF9103_02876 [Lentilactobacillus parafarraginis F0439]|uniref:Uncharacterized protein n=1 Tax=Lentilactobacillus parafarraginis F0439 TaxID=797515 RepID=G9ZSW0_9LACO|nr:hypothetical protein HMPREF9103_02876 [Lentilactobacillus parafarraginis F0439]
MRAKASKKFGVWWPTNFPLILKVILWELAPAEIIDKKITHSPPTIVRNVLPVKNGLNLHKSRLQIKV